MARRRADQNGNSEQHNDYVPGQLIVRFKESAVYHMASHRVARSATARVAAAAMPDEVAGPLKLLRDEVGLASVKPLFVTDKPAKPPAGGMTLAAAHGMLVRSAQAPRETLRGFQLVEVSDKKLRPALLKKLRASNAVELVEPVPNRWLCSADPLINRQWGLRAIRWFDGRRPSAKSIHVAVIDSGIDEGHPDLTDAIEEYRHDGNGQRDFLGHGSHVAGIIAAVVNNEIGIAGIANCRLHPWKVFDDPPRRSSEQIFNFEFYAAALADALDSKIKVVNLSIGGGAFSRTEATIFEELRKAGVVAVAAMGNEKQEGNPKEYPAGYPNVLAVGAVDEVSRVADFSCTGKHIGLVAPGVNILSTVPRQKAILADATDYEAWPGTSMATPHVAAAAAILYAGRAKSAKAAESIVKRLASSARKLPGMKKKRFTPEYGSGLLDLTSALIRW